MNPHQWLGIGACVVLVAFIVFAFRQGRRVKPDDRGDSGYGASGTEGDGHSGADHPG